MKIHRWSALVALGIALSAISCTTMPRPIALAPVGPRPGSQPTSAHTGFLKVYSEVRWSVYKVSDVWVYPDYERSHYFAHTDYDVYDAAGKRIENVQNTEALHSLEPKQVSLPPGDYNIKAWTDADQLVMVPIVIKAGCLTIVNLEKKDRQLFQGAHSDDLVHAPDGRIVGWADKAR